MPGLDAIPLLRPGDRYLEDRVARRPRTFQNPSDQNCNALRAASKSELATVV
jgi:hypothetical protein